MGTLLLVLLQLIVSIGYVNASLYTYEFRNRCGDVINVYQDSRPSGLVNVSLRTPPMSVISNPCDVTIEPGYVRPAVLFYFTEIVMPGCDIGGVEILVATSSRNTLKPFPDQARRVCGVEARSIINNIYTTQEAPLTFRFSWDNLSSTSVSASFTLFYNTFNELGDCEDFECTNGRCIDHSATCSGYDSCGDNSDCPGKDEATGNVQLSFILVPTVFVGAFVIISVLMFACCGSSSSGGSKVEMICECLCSVLYICCWPCRKAYDNRQRCSECARTCWNAACSPCRKAYANRQRCSDCVSSSGRAIRNCPHRLACCLSLCKSSTAQEAVTSQPAVTMVSTEIQTQSPEDAGTHAISLSLDGATGNTSSNSDSDSPPPYGAVSHKPDRPKGQDSNRRRPRPLPSAPPTTADNEDSPPTYDAVMENFDKYAKR